MMRRDKPADHDALRRSRPVVAMLACLLIQPIVPALAAPASFSAWQEIVLLTVMKVRHAANNCGFRIAGSQIDTLLTSASLTERDVAPQRFTSSLQRQSNADADLYLGNKDDACRAAWDRFGPDGAPGVRDFLQE